MYLVYVKQQFASVLELFFPEISVNSRLPLDQGDSLLKNAESVAGFDFNQPELESIFYIVYIYIYI